MTVRHGSTGALPPSRRTRFGEPRRGGPQKRTASQHWLVGSHSDPTLAEAGRSPATKIEASMIEASMIEPSMIEASMTEASMAEAS